MSYDTIEQLAQALVDAPTSTNLARLLDLLQETGKFEDHDSWGKKLTAAAELDLDWAQQFGRSILTSCAMREKSAALLERYNTHSQLIRKKVDEFRAEAKRAYKARRVGDGYWLSEFADLLTSNIGYVDVYIRNSYVGLECPPPGVIWVRPASSGRYGRSRKTWRGRALTLEEMQAMLESQDAQRVD